MGVKGFAMSTVNSISNATRKKNIDYFVNAPEYHCESKNIIHIASSSNLMVFSENGEKLYFKECRRHSDKDIYARTVVADYFDYVVREETWLEVKKIILNDLKDKDNLNRFCELHNFVTHNYSTIKEYSGWETSIIGLPSLSGSAGKSQVVDEFLEIDFPKFIEYARNEMDAYCMNAYIGMDDFQTYRSSLSIATRKLAELYDLEFLVPSVWYAKVVIDGVNVKYGTIMEEAPGRCSLELSMEEKQKITPEFQRQLNILNLFDVICFQRDHKQENYFVIYDEEERADKVCAFDNDYTLAFYSLPLVSFETCIKCSPYIVGGKINRPYVDRSLANKINTVSLDSIKKYLSEDLSSVQIFMLWQRIKYVRKALKSGEGQQYVLLNRDEWNKETIAHEVNGNYGKTYLKHYLECDEDALVAEIMNNQ